MKEYRQEQQKATKLSKRQKWLRANKVDAKFVLN